ncbi:hypothetical protein [Actinomadura sp. 6K520]|uniref:hypothetical protein n=1 Tax=Actinomadura sp. 6K520 TaxID=2530364 RepID=UPI00104F5BCF|nr:hypothetical protein [Actinomadura sp. 6K520]TDE34075.1 hypothetical protein E1289_10695 [Actinomadura sp. 6K520]
MSEWAWEYDPDDLLDGLPPEAITEIESLAREIATRDSMLFPEGAAHTGDVPGLQREHRGRLMVAYLPDVRGERIVIVRVLWLG